MIDSPYMFDFAPPGRDRLFFRAYADRLGDCDLIEWYDVDADSWEDVEDSKRGLPDVAGLVWRHYFDLIEGEGY